MPLSFFMVDKVLKLLLLLSPIAYGVGIPLDKFDLIFFHIGTMALITASFFDKPVRTLENVGKPFACFLALIILNLFWHSFHPVILINSLNIIFASIILSIIVMYCRKPEDCFKYILYAVAINVVVFFLQRIGFNPILNKDLTIGEEGGIMGNAPRMVTYFTLVFSLVPIWMKAILLGIGLAVREMAVFILAWLMALVFCVQRAKKKKFYFIGILLLVTIMAMACFLFQEKIFESFRLRFAIWLPTIEKIFKRPLLGYGLGMYPEVARQFITIKFIGQPVVCAFNSILQFIFGVGCLGMVWLGYTLRHFRKGFDASSISWCVVSILILSSLEYPFETPRLWFTILAIIGFFVIKTQKEGLKNYVSRIQG